jgi:hypothetical protein
MGKKLKSLKTARKSLKAEIKFLEKHLERGEKLEKPHPFLKGYLDGVQNRLIDARQQMRAVKWAIKELKSGPASEQEAPKQGATRPVRKEDATSLAGSQA